MRSTAICGILLLSSVASAAPDFVLQDMHPPGYGYSQMLAASGGVRVGALLKVDESYWQGALWLDGSQNFKSITPPGYDDWWGNDVRNGQIAGHARIQSGAHAAIWSADGENFLDLHPSHLRFSTAYGTDGTQQVGEGYLEELRQSHAMLWAGTAQSVVDLNPQGAIRSTARAVANGQQVGSAADVTAFEHAYLWRGTAESAVDLNPPGATFSQIESTDGMHQAGSASWDEGDHVHAVLWSGTAQSAVDLHPAGFVSSGLLDNFGDYQVGWGTLPDGTGHALLWKGTAESVIDLHQFVPAGFPNSQATGIDNVDGAIVGMMWYEDGGNVSRAVVWTVPEPTSLALLAASLVGSLRRRRI